MNVHYKPHQQDAFRAKGIDAPRRVSILINNFNYERFVADAITSAFAQTHDNIEVIVVDDGSTDGSLDVMRSLQALYPDLKIITKENGGQASAMNVGFAACSGDFVVFLDSDDMLDPDAVEAALTVIGDDTAFVQFYLRTVDRQGQITGLHPFCHFVEDGEVFRQVLTSGNFRFMPTSGNLFTREALRLVFPMAEQHWRICADSFLVAAAAASGRVVTLPRILGSYRTHGSNAWFEDEETPERLREISRNHNRLWFDLFSVVGRALDRKEADFASLSLIRRIVVATSVAPAGTFTEKDLKQCRRSLRRVLRSLDVPHGERLLHWLMIRAIGTRNCREELARLLGYRDPTSILGRLSGTLTSPRRHDWLRSTREPARIAELEPGDLVEFGQRGNGRDYLWYGFGSTENWASWSSAERSGLIFRVPETASSLDLKLDLTPSLAPPAVTTQSLLIEANGECLWKGTLTARKTIDVKLGRRLISQDKGRIVRLNITAAGAFVPSLLNKEASASRVTAFGINTLKAVSRTRAPAMVPVDLPAMIRPTDQGAQAIFHSGWDLSEGVARQTGLKAQLRFLLPNPVMERFAIVLDFEQPQARAPGDWRVKISGDGLGGDIIDLQQSSQLILKVPRGKAPRNGVINLVIDSSNFLPLNVARPSRSGNRLKSVRVLNYKSADPNMPVMRDGLTIDFTDPARGGPYIRSGWHAPDPSGSWASAPRSVLSGLYFNRESEVFLTLGLATLMRGARIGQQNVVIEANGVRVAAQAVEGQGEIFAVIPRGTIGEDYLLQIAVYSSAVGSPSRLGPYAEPRAVGLCLKSLKVESLVIDPLPVMLTTEPDRSARMSVSATA